MVLLLALLLVLIFFGAGFALHILWIVAVVLLVLWVIGFAMGAARELGETSSTAGESLSLLRVRQNRELRI